MADRLLVETSAVDGYLLEDGTGVLLMELTTVSATPTLDAVIIPTFALDAVLVRTIAGSFALDAIVLRTQTEHQLLYDSFTDVDGTLLTAHTGETGHTW